MLFLNDPEKELKKKQQIYLKNLSSLFLKNCFSINL